MEPNEPTPPPTPSPYAVQPEPCDHCGAFVDPVSFTDVHGKRICRTCIAEGRVYEGALPWERRDELGFLPALWQTILELSGNPSAVFSKIRPDGGLQDALFFAFLIAIPVALAGAVWNLTINNALFGSSPEEMQAITDALGPQAAQILSMLQPGSLVGALGTALVAPFASVLFMLLYGLVHHAVLLLIGGAPKGLEATLKTSLYATGVNFWAVIPLANMLTGFWVMFLQALGYARVHDQPVWKGAVAVLLPLFLCVCGAMILAFAIVFGVMGAMGNL